ncbi:MAG TPA: phosphatase PAP2 family protein [Opitutaceae bacterium]|nr:phosphatase PAP2 family protein [Opitutaceae bacterium]
MRFGSRVFAYLLLAPGLLAGARASAQAAADTPPPLFSAEYVHRLWGDVRGVLKEPASWDDTDWRDAALWTGATLAAAGLDGDVRREVQTHDRTRGENRFFRNWEQLGAAGSFVEIGAFEAWGVAAADANARGTALDAVSATVIASGIVTPVLKYSFGRYRPSQTSRTFKFRPFSGHQSFPSGHATQAFAVATVVAAHYPAAWEQALAYGAAILVDASRIQQNAHFASDVVAGSAIGWAVGRAVAHRHLLPGGYSVSPWFSDGAGLMLSRDF